MPRNKQVSRKAISRPYAKTVRETPQNIDKRPVWRFSSTDKSGPFPWPIGEDAELVIVGKLHEFDSMTWDEITGKQHHALSMESLSKEAIRRLEEIEFDDDHGSLFSFHIQGQSRIIAIRHLNIAKLLWYDPGHKVSPSVKKHT
uniref:Uncharacterized protein n=1 Tax=Candidatus Kentrum sp. DK TaxID=2126562 RepID=A0A450TAV8_9GAMM|nr:MAG: hypothetical protein BECKDK2373C_GA0170839_111212 [Candidatus Kentron sp. DK]